MAKIDWSTEDTCPVPAKYYEVLMATPTTPEAIAQLHGKLRDYLSDPVSAKAAMDAMIYGEGRFMTYLSERKHRYVRYDASVNRVVYEDPETFYFADCSPSSSRWMVPCSPFPGS